MGGKGGNRASESLRNSREEAVDLERGLEEEAQLRRDKMVVGNIHGMPFKVKGK